MKIRKISIWLIIIYILLAITILLTLFPIVYLFLISVKPTKILFDYPPKIIFSPTFITYEELLIKESQYVFFGNSFIVVTISTIISLFLGSLGAYAFVHFKFTMKKILFFIILITRMYPPVTTLIPIYLMIKYIGLVDTRTALIIIYTATQMPLIIWVMKGFFEQIPIEIQESALLDGCTPIDTFFRIVLPLSKPGLIAAAILVFIINWNEFLFALVLTSFNAKTAPVAIMSFLEQEGKLQWGLLAAMGTLTVFPVILFMLFTGKYLIKGLTAGALKG